MTDQKEKKREVSFGPDGEVCRDLICPEDWKDPQSRKVITEFHKEGLPKNLVGVDADLETFEQYWKKKGGTVKVKGEYHKNGAPFLDREKGSNIAIGSVEQAGVTEAKSVEVESEMPSAEGEPEESPRMEGAAGTSPPQEQSTQNKIQRPIDLGLIEMVSYTLFRVVFSKGLSIPIKRDGTVDMDVTVKGKEITINTNQLFFSVPELNVWHVVYQHKGKPVVELGRGVKNGMSIHRVQALKLALEMWNGSRKMNKLKLKQMKEADKKAHIEAAK
ncbi:MAG TPA: hypothetical protein VGK23_11435 [Methanomassiliicoccales archaeon]